MQSDRVRRFLNVGGNRKSIPVPEYFQDWEHILLDIDPDGSPDIVCDARDMSSIEAASFDAVYCSHNLEHFAPHDVSKVLAGFVRVLKPSGFALVRVPDIGAVVNKMAETGHDIEDVLYEAAIGPITYRDVFYGHAGHVVNSEFWLHRTGFTYKSLVRALSMAGFNWAIRRKGRSKFEISVQAWTTKPDLERDETSHLF